MLWILNNWKILAAGMALLFFAGAVHWVDSQIYQNKQEAALRTQARQLQEQCQADKQLTTGVNNALQNDLRDVSARLDALRMQRPAQCVPVTSKTRISTSGDRHAGSHGVTSDALRGYAADCEIERRGYVACNAFIDRVWAAQKQ